jgi:hypothetical protein
MKEPMPPENDSATPEPFRELETQLADLRAAAKSLREQRPSWADNVFHPGRRARQEADFSAAMVSAVKEFAALIRTALDRHESELAELKRQLSDLRTGEVAQLRERQERMARDHSAAITDAVGAATTDAARRVAELRQQIEQVGNDYEAKIAQLAAGQKELANEFRERIQHLLDEQRVSVRQLALKASEDAVLNDRARRATELKLEDLAKRLPPAPPA